ncbi:Response regulator c-di-GMP phosphodiesterase, RpfG family, contains REC and HD-GYP domains [Aromatoleum tolulyticum]|uniref:Response regulator c-di-GMP phosphodiesterase, RpfG family, contains REC and HD-GYP domains n=1 Tax=Aromatoleum tolulyticum TaxID=34027 RepID=A0A1N6ZRJ8_9RHOO|nr:HD domain-containing phosphohydrolase [Aromatoleum tolulyticum]SIR29336.1 Response regulator c-di-GMP phosphodiesterase, RpfG family, contains REC and HD-GYP domains [Aromatoleum tolulyticum]
MTDMSGTAPSILLVDDEASILSSLRRLLRPSGYTIHLAESGKAGLEVLEREHVDVVVSDMRMPEMDGAQFLEHVRNRWPGIVRLLLTGYADIGSTIDAINRGQIYRYISKPWDDNDLMLILRDALERRRLQSENERLQALTQAQNAELKELNSGLEQKVQERTRELEQANASLKVANERQKQNFLVSIKTFSGLMELRSGGVAGHARRVADQARKLAAHLGVDAKNQQDIFLAGLLHDIGKIGFSDAMLAKPVARMNGEEMGLYRKHALAGESALMPLDELKGAAHLIRAHHERFDGQGFPDGLQGLAIPLGARILSVVNDYDGLQIGTLADKLLNRDEALAMLVRSRGKRYDPQVVDAFVELLGGVAQEPPSRDVAVAAADLQPGMVLARDLVGRDGALLLAADYVLDESLVRQIQNYARREGIALTLQVRGDK